MRAHTTCQALAPAQTRIQIIRQNYTKILKAFARPETQWATHTHTKTVPVRRAHTYTAGKAVTGSAQSMALEAVCGSCGARNAEWSGRGKRERGREGKQEGGGNVRRAESH